MELVVDFANPSDKQQLWNHLKQCRPTKYRVIVKLERDSLTKRQRSYYHGVVIPTLADFCGYTHEEMHDLLKSMFNSERKYVEMTGKYITVVHSTESLDVYEYGRYLDKVLRWGAQELACYVPEPSKTILQAV